MNVEDRTESSIQRSSDDLLGVVALVLVPAVVMVVMVQAVAVGFEEWAIATLAIQALALPLLALARRKPASEVAWLFMIYLFATSLTIFGRNGATLRLGPLLVGGGIAAGLIHGKRGALVAGAATALLGIAMSALSANGWEPSVPAGQRDPSTARFWVLTIVMFAVGAVAIAWTVMRLRKQLDDSTQLVGATLRRLGAARQRRWEAEQALERSLHAQLLSELATTIGPRLTRDLTVVADEATRLLGRDADDQRRELLEDLVDAAHKGRQTTAQLEALAIPAHVGQVRCDASQVVARVARTIERGLPDNIDLVVNVGAFVSARITDANLDRIVHNLIVNARDAMADGGTIRVTVSSISGGRFAGGATLEVQDEGCGMSPETQARIFEPFFTTKPQGRGTGLGLASVYRLVTATGGRIRVRSSLGEGSTFVIELAAH